MPRRRKKNLSPQCLAALARVQSLKVETIKDKERRQRLIAVAEQAEAAEKGEEADENPMIVRGFAARSR